jgi:hypothetical protein
MAGGFYGSGIVFAERIINGVGTGLRSFDNASKFEITESAEREDRISNGLSSYGNALSSVYDKKPTELEIMSNNFDLDNVALQLLADTEINAVTTSAITAEAETITATRVIEVFGKNLAATVVVKDAGGTVLASELVSASLGLIKVIGGNVGDPVTVDYDTLAFNEKVAFGSKHSSIEMRFVLDGVNRDGGAKVVVEIPRVIMTPNDPVDFLGKKFADVTLSGVIIKLEGQELYTTRFKADA